MSVAPELLVRTIEQSPKILKGLETGLFEIWGGVIRVAKGNDKAGSIVAHLKFPDDMGQTRQSIENLQTVLTTKMDGLQGGVDALQGSMKMLQNLQYANLALSGLNLAVTTAGFVIVYQKLNRIEDVLEKQSQQLDSLVILALEAHQREAFRDEACFRASIQIAHQFAEMGEIDQLKTMLPSLKKQYEYNRLLLQGLASKASRPEFAASLDVLHAIQDRFMYLGFFLSHVQQKVGATKYAFEHLESFQEDWKTINETIVSKLTEDKKVIYQLEKQQGDKLISLLTYRKERLPAIEYQTHLLMLAEQRPELLEAITSNSSEILLLAA